MKGAGRDRTLARAGLDGALQNGGYLARLNREEMEAALALELMKGYLGRPGADPQLLESVRR